MEYKNKEQILRQLGAIESIELLNTTGTAKVAYFEKGSVMFSYNSIIGFVFQHKIYLIEKYMEWSVTTSKHRYMWLQMSKSEIIKKIKENKIEILK